MEKQYLNILKEILNEGDIKEGRNGRTFSLSGVSLKFNVDKLPVLTTRKMFIKGILGEYATFIRQPTSLKDFEKWGCNFWKPWAEADGSLKVDYGNAWIDYNGVNQYEEALKLLKEEPTSRRIIIDAWRVGMVDSLSLPCCHFVYQFVSDGTHLDLVWTQRSGDWMVGVPSDCIVASIMLNHFSILSGLKARKVIMNIADAHVYMNHVQQAHFQLRRVPYEQPDWVMYPDIKDLYSFEPKHVIIGDYESHPSMKLEINE